MNSKEVKKFAKKNALALWIVGIILLIALVIFAIFYFTKPETREITLEIGNSPVLGDVNAPVTIYEFSDFSCPYCAAFAGKSPSIEASLESRIPGWEAPIPLLIENYVETGKAKIVFKYYPGHGAGLQAHMIALALNEQNSSLFWSFADEAYANQGLLDDVAKMREIAKSLGADMTLLEKNLQTSDYYSMLKNDANAGLSIGIRGTPTFVIGKKIFEGPTYEKLAQEIDSAL